MLPLIHALHKKDTTLIDKFSRMDPRGMTAKMRVSRCAKHVSTFNIQTPIVPRLKVLRKKTFNSRQSGYSCQQSLSHFATKVWPWLHSDRQLWGAQSSLEQSLNRRQMSTSARQRRQTKSPSEKANKSSKHSVGKAPRYATKFVKPIMDSVIESVINESPRNQVVSGICGWVHEPSEYWIPDICNRLLIGHTSCPWAFWDSSQKLLL